MGSKDLEAESTVGRLSSPVVPKASTVRDAGSPFNAQSADVILRSADNVDFRAHRVILSIASKVFSETFSRPIATNDDAQISEKLNEVKDGLSVVSMAEDERGLEMLLRFCYPVEQPKFTTTEDIVLGLRLVRKFQLVHVQNPKEQLMLLTQREPERAYAIACTFQLRDVALSAAQKSLLNRNEVLSLNPEFGAISSFDLIRLRNYHAAVLSNMRDVPLNLKWVPRNAMPFTLSAHVNPGPYYRHACGNESCPPLPYQTFGLWKDCGDGKNVLFKPWFQTYLTAATNALLRSPEPSVVQSYDTLFQAYDEAATCPLCKAQARDALPKFAALLAKRLSEVTLQVQLELSF